MHARAHGILAAVLFALAFASVSAVNALAFAQGEGVSTASADDRRQAAKDFADGDRAFKEGDYRGAAVAYERAYARVPHHSALWNAARAWQRAGELARAANHYAHYLR